MICNKCQFDIASNTFERHFISCNGKGTRRSQVNHICPHCKLTFYKGLGAHTIWCKDNPNIEQTREKLKNRKPTIFTDEVKKRLSAIAKKRGLGGHTSKRKLNFVKRNGEVVYLQSSYEIKFAEILEQLNINWTRPPPLNWIDNHGDSHKYYPDFLIKDIYIDTKNSYLIEKDQDKIKAVREQNNIDLRVVPYESITEQFIMSLE